MTETLFFVCCTGIIYGILKEKPTAVFIFIYLATLTRASYLFFLIPFWGIFLMKDTKSEPFNNKKWVEFLGIYILPIILGVLSVSLIQHTQTGLYFGYYEVQGKWWGRKFSIPWLPINNSGAPEIIQISSNINFWLGCFFLVLGVDIFYRWLKENIKYEGFSQILVLSIGYLCMAWASIVFFNPKWNWTSTPQGGYSATSITGINRYMECSVFLFIAMTHYFTTPKLSWKTLILLFLASHIVWFLVAPDFYQHIQKYLKLAPVIVIIATYFLYHQLKWKPLGYALVAFSLYYQCIMMNDFFTGIQID